MQKEYSTIGCCGIDCGLCPRFYTDGHSRCPGCGGSGFGSKHPPCSLKTCCTEKHSLEICSQCIEFPCQKYKDKKKIERDSFVTHKKIFKNHEQIKALGIGEFISNQNKRISILQDLLANFDEGRSKSYFCLAAALLSTECLQTARDEATLETDRKRKAKALKAALQKCAEMENVILSLNA